MKDFDGWLDDLPAMAARDLAGGGYALRSVALPEVLAMIRAGGEPLRRAKESRAVETRSAKWLAAQDPRVLRDLKIRYGLVD